MHGNNFTTVLLASLHSIRCNGEKFHTEKQAVLLPSWCKAKASCQPSPGSDCSYGAVSAPQTLFSHIACVQCIGRRATASHGCQVRAMHGTGCSHLSRECRARTLAKHCQGDTWSSQDSGTAGLLRICICCSGLQNPPDASQAGAMPVTASQQEDTQAAAHPSVVPPISGCP